MEKIIQIRNNLNGFLYRNFVKQIAFMFDAERVHNLFIKKGRLLGSNKFTRKIVRDIFHYENPSLRQEILGINFVNPVGLSAGFDKNAEIIDICDEIGFGFSEVGSVTAKPCAGNAGKRLLRIKERRSIWVNLGLNNNGVDEIANRLKGKKFDIPYAVSIAKTNSTETIDDTKGIEDYFYTLKKLDNMDIGSFYVINISCPNSFGGQPFSRPVAYKSLLKQISKIKVRKPIFVKLSPDLTKKNIDQIIKISEKYSIDGFICTNLTKKHEFGKGGMSGKAVEEKSLDLLQYIYKKTKGKFVLVSVGGIFSAQDAYQRIRNGASLVEVITGMIYQGPQLISQINQGMVRLLKKDGLRNISEAVGADFR